MSCIVPFLNLCSRIHVLVSLCGEPAEILDFHLLLHALAVRLVLIDEVNVRTDCLVGQGRNSILTRWECFFPPVLNAGRERLVGKILAFSCIYHIYRYRDLRKFVSDFSRGFVWNDLKCWFLPHHLNSVYDSYVFIGKCFWHLTM